MSLALNQTGQKLLQKAQKLLQENGYQFLSFQDIANAVGIRKASVHHYFRTKEDLARQMISDYTIRLDAWITNTEKKNLNPPEKLRAYFQIFANISNSGKAICPAGSLLLDWNNFSQPLQEELQKLIFKHHQWLKKILLEADEAKISRVPLKEIDAHCTLIGTSIQGALQLARASKDSPKLLKKVFQRLEEITFQERTL